MPKFRSKPCRESEEPSIMLLPFTSGYIDGAFNDPPEMYEYWQRSKETERIPLFSDMYGSRVTPYTRPGHGRGEYRLAAS